MNTEPTSRRGFLLHGAAVMTSFAMAPGCAAPARAAPTPASASSAGAGRPSAAAAGTLLIGDLAVNRLGFGAMRITGSGVWGEPRDHGEALAVLRRAIELGTNFVDTADAYGPGVSELLIREALHPYPPDLVIATKGGLVRPSATAWVSDGRPAHLREACVASLKRLHVEQITLYQLHRPDPHVPFEDSVGELAQLQREGKIRHIGLSNVDKRQLAAARALVKVVSVQNRYNVADRDSDEVLALCERDGIAFLPWAPLAEREQGAAMDPRIETLAAIARERKIDMAQAALAWLLARSPVMLPIPGTSRVAHLEDNIAAAALRLSQEEMKRVG